MTAASWVTDEAIDAAWAEYDATGANLADHMPPVIAAALDKLIEQQVVCRRPTRQQIADAIHESRIGSTGALVDNYAVDAIQQLLDNPTEET